MSGEMPLDPKIPWQLSCAACMHMAHGNEGSSSQKQPACMGRMGGCSRTSGAVTATASVMGGWASGCGIHDAGSGPVSGRQSYGVAAARGWADSCGCSRPHGGGIDTHAPSTHMVLEKQQGGAGRGGERQGGAERGWDGRGGEGRGRTG